MNSDRSVCTHFIKSSCRKIPSTRWNKKGKNKDTFLESFSAAILGAEFQLSWRYHAIAICRTCGKRAQVWPAVQPMFVNNLCKNNAYCRSFCFHFCINLSLNTSIQKINKCFGLQLRNDARSLTRVQKPYRWWGIQGIMAQPPEVQMHIPILSSDTHWHPISFSNRLAWATHPLQIATLRQGAPVFRAKSWWRAGRGRPWAISLFFPRVYVSRNMYRRLKNIVWLVL